MKTDVTDLGSSKHLFIDLSLADHTSNVALGVNPPRLGGIAIGRDRAWEHHIHFQNTVLDDNGLGRCWYLASIIRGGLESARFGYAESEDGRHWRKPNLGLLELNGRRDMNLIPPKPKRSNVFIDPTAPPAERYKTFGLSLEGDPGGDGYGVFASPDGYVFRELGCNGLRLAGDTQNMAFWDDRIGRYVAYLRGFSHHPDGRRRRAVARWETDDLTSRDGWDLSNEESDRHVINQLPIVIACDDDDPPDMDIYTPSVVKYPGADDVYFATMSMYHHFTPDEMDDTDPPRNDGLMDIQLAVSRDGISWDRPDRRPYVGIDAEGPGQRMCYAVQGILVRGDTVLQYHTAYDQSHGHKRQNNPGGVIRWTEQRLDGFVSANFAYTGGELVTRPITFDGSKLILNVDASASGEGRVEIQDAHGRPIPGRTLADCDRILGNYLRHPVTWGGDSNLGVPPNTPIRLRFALRSARLFALQFTEASV